MASIFSRFADIISSNINSMLDKAENPVKMVKLIIAEMEDTLVEIKAACAQTMADQAKSARRLIYKNGGNAADPLTAEVRCAARQNFFKMIEIKF